MKKGRKFKQKLVVQYHKSESRGVVKWVGKDAFGKEYAVVLWDGGRLVMMPTDMLLLVVSSNAPVKKKRCRS